jgi:uncharacterized protein (TIGR03067 family)
MSSAIDGIWEMVRAELDGETAPEMFVGKTEIELARGAYVVRFGGVISDRGSFELGDTLESKTIILHGIEGQNAGRIIPCIYQRVGDRLRVCYGLSGVAPTDFSTASGQQRYLATYRLKSPAQQV